jgi:hypothetical protein
MTAMALDVRELTVDELDWIGGGPSRAGSVSTGIGVGYVAGIFGAVEGAELGALYGSCFGPVGFVVGGLAGMAFGYGVYLHMMSMSAG